jgi:SNF2 family DNA or RNA helicase
MLISKDYQEDAEAVEPAPPEEDDGGELANMFGQLNFENAKCQFCQIPCVPRPTIVFVADRGLVLRLDAENRANSKRCKECFRMAERGRSRESSGLPPDSAKIRKLLEILDEIEAREEGEKTIVFSQFTSMLDLIQPFLDHRKIKYVRCKYSVDVTLLLELLHLFHCIDDGSMKKENRDASLNTIRDSKSIRVILISFKAGGTGVSTTFFTVSLVSSQMIGLNLTACNNVILFDLWWNPALEVRFLTVLEQRD